MNIRLQQQNPTIGDLDKNFSLIEKAIVSAESAGVDLLLFPELATCGYPPLDLLRHQSFLDEVYAMNRAIADLVSETTVIMGTVTPNAEATGRACFNGALVLEQGAVKDEIHKTLLPTYDVYDELRYFQPNDRFQCVTVGGRKIGVTICEDIWYNYSDPQYLIYDVNPARKLVESGAEIIVNLSASPYTRNKPEGRLKMLRRHTKDLQVPVLYVNQVGGNTDLVSDGDSLALDSRGTVVGRAPMFQESFLDVQWQDTQLSNKAKPSASVPPVSEQQFRCLKLGLQDYLSKTGITDRVLLGLSGGIDSALVACIAKEALGADKVLGITMPSQFSTTGSISDSEVLAENLDIEIRQLAIEDIYEAFTHTLNPLFEGTNFGVAEENLQPRIRGTLLMAYSNKFGHMLLNTGNKSELATGYCTLYGDMAGGLAVIADLYKTEVYAISRWLNEDYMAGKSFRIQFWKNLPARSYGPIKKIP